MTVNTQSEQKSSPDTLAVKTTVVKRAHQVLANDCTVAEPAVLAHQLFISSYLFLLVRSLSSVQKQTCNYCFL